MGKLRVLLITRECLRTDSNEGNVLFGLFSGIDAECANIYCKPGLPDNSLCGGYFQLTDKMALENILHRKPMGRRVQCENGINAAQTAEVEKRGFYDFSAGTICRCSTPRASVCGVWRIFAAAN